MGLSKGGWHPAPKFEREYEQYKDDDDDEYITIYRGVSKNAGAI